MNRALIQLADALCEWERDTGKHSALIIRSNDFSYRALDGKPIDNLEITDSDIINLAIN